MKTKVCGFISVVFFILTAFFVSCEVGLGAAVNIINLSPLFKKFKIK